MIYAWIYIFIGVILGWWAVEDGRKHGDVTIGDLLVVIFICSIWPITLSVAGVSYLKENNEKVIFKRKQPNNSNHENSKD